MAIGWVFVGSDWYYLDASGAMLVGRHQLGNAVYQFDIYGHWQP